MKILHLTLKKKWFDLIASCEKLEEYREIKDYWTKRLIGKEYDIIRFRNGYSPDSPTMDVEFKGVRCDYAKPEWSNNSQGLFYVISLGKILKFCERN